MNVVVDLKVHLNGRLVPGAQAAVSVFDTGLLHGASIFTTMLAHNGRVFRLDRHLKRLLATAERLSMRHGQTAEGLSAAMDEVLRANGLKEARARITLTAGAVGQDPAPTTIVSATPLEGNPRWWYEKGVTVAVCGVRQYSGDPLGGLKTGCYLPRILARQAAAAKGAEEALWFTESGHLAEACFCNVFLVRGGTVLTPPVSTPVLPGVVRQAVVELCADLGVPSRDEKPLTYDQTLSADEMFLTASVAGIRPVVRVERQAVGDEKPGPVTQRIMSAYADLLEKECPAGGE